MNSKYLAILSMIFGLLFVLAQSEPLTKRNYDDDSDDSDDTYDQEKRAILNFLQDDNNANEFLDQSRRLLTDSQKSQMKEAKEKYEEKCERTLHARYCPDLSTWDAWNKAYAAATGKK